MSANKKHEHRWHDISTGADGRRLQACAEHGCINTRVVA